MLWLDRARSILEAAELEHDAAAAALDALPPNPESSVDVLGASRQAISHLRALRGILDTDAASDELFTTGGFRQG